MTWRLQGCPNHSQSHPLGGGTSSKSSFWSAKTKNHFEPRLPGWRDAGGSGQLGAHRLWATRLDDCPWADLVLAPASVSRYFWPYAPRSCLYLAVAQQFILPSSSSPRGAITSLDCCWGPCRPCSCAPLDLSIQQEGEHLYLRRL